MEILHEAQLKLLQISPSQANPQTFAAFNAEPRSVYMKAD